jgi:hypothetical protein
MKAIDKANALSTFVRLLNEEVERIDKKYIKLVKSNNAPSWQVEDLHDTIVYYEELIDKVNDWAYDKFIEHEKSEDNNV